MYYWLISQNQWIILTEWKLYPTTHCNMQVVIKINAIRYILGDYIEINISYKMKIDLDAQHIDRWEVIQISWIRQLFIIKRSVEWLYECIKLSLNKFFNLSCLSSYPQYTDKNIHRFVHCSLHFTHNHYVGGISGLSESK